MGKKSAVESLRKLPVVIVSGWLVYLALCLSGIVIPIEIFMVTGGFYVIHLLSSCLGFCHCHRAMIQYAYACTLCMWANRYKGLGEYLFETRLAMFAVGLVIMIVFFFDYIKSKKDGH